MKDKEKQISIVLIVFLLIMGINFGIFRNNRYYFPAVPKPSIDASTDLTSDRIEVEDDFESNIRGTMGRTNYKDKTISIDKDFTSNLPLIVIDTAGKKPKRGVIWDKDKGYNVSTGEDPYVDSKISIIDDDKGPNSLASTETTNYSAEIKIRGNSSGNYDKKQYLIKLVNEKGKSTNENLLDMGKSDEWVLNISFIDKSLLRNYLAYSTAGVLWPYTPDVKFCEVIWKDGDEYRYEGVYLLMESVSVSKNRVDLPKYSENSNRIPTLIRRDRYNENGIMLNNYATRNGLTPGYLDIEYPSKKNITQKGIDTITAQIDKFESVLYAENWEDFINYRDHIDMKSFVDYFILNEYFMNYDAGYHSTYFYMNYSGKITMGPVWDFDQAMDNDEEQPVKLDTTAFHATPWFDKILQDPVFTETLIARYTELRKSLLSDEAIESYIEDTIEYLGPAIDRDWARWGYYYEHGDYFAYQNAEYPNRNTYTHREEVERILKTLSEHAKWMDEHLDSLYQFKMLSLEDAKSLEASHTKDYRPLLATTFVLAFVISINLVLKYENE